MSIRNHITIIHRIEVVLNKIIEKYRHQHLALEELEKLENSLQNLNKYLSALDQLKPNYSTDRVNEYFKEIELHLAILKVELKKEDYRKLCRGIKILETAMRFHPTRYTFVSYILAWLYELIYFI